MSHAATILATIPGADERERLLVTACADGSLALVQESFADGVGWFAQKTLALMPEQARQLRAVFGWAGAAVQPRQPKATLRMRSPKIIPFSAARAESA